ncbi:hypothetical protein B0H10DRAFT_2166100 [Mycena sp. CBHHK59/15]|nr:hypothetical protein B0H10DRAFT_2166100 [Mycena sp. CBHHK59/15]
MLKVAIVGGGPSAFYLASRLLSRSSALHVHVYDRLWAPHGLVRYGVAPDHPEVKNCTHKFDAVAADSRFRFFGNVNVGPPPPAPLPAHVLPLPLDDLRAHYSHLVFATGCPRPVLHPALPPSPWCVPALDIVHWYTRHPAAPPPPPLETTPHVTLIGAGNVALDVARILLSPPDALAAYDVPQPVLDRLARSAVRHVSILARRGPLHAAFTAKELRELLALPGASPTPLPPALLAVPEGVVPTRQQARLLQLLAQATPRPGAPRTWSLDFFTAPTCLEPPAALGSPARLLLEHTAVDPTTQRAVPAGPAPPLDTHLVVTALGFRPEFPSFGLPAGMGLGLRADAEGTTRAGPRRVYASGWAATGARGVLAATMQNAYAVADTMLTDIAAESASSSPADVPVDGMHPAPANAHPPPRSTHVDSTASAVPQYADWARIDAEEVRRGAARGKERERMAWAEAAAFLRGAGSDGAQTP